MLANHFQFIPIRKLAMFESRRMSSVALKNALLSSKNARRLSKTVCPLELQRRKARSARLWSILRNAVLSGLSVNKSARKHDTNYPGPESLRQSIFYKRIGFNINDYKTNVNSIGASIRKELVSLVQEGFKHGVDSGMKLERAVKLSKHIPAFKKFDEATRSALFKVIRFFPI